jgi:hypothetical protein
MRFAMDKKALDFIAGNAGRFGRPCWTGWLHAG